VTAAKPKKRKTVSFTFDSRHLKRGKHSAVLFLPKEYFAPLGLVVSYWGVFEQVFDKALSALLKMHVDSGAPNEAPNWQTLSFKSRAKLFRGLCKDTLSNEHEALGKSLATLVARAVRYSNQRETLVQGRFTQTYAVESDAAHKCQAHHQKTNEPLEFDVDDLKRLFHNISHLTIDFVNLFSELERIVGEFYTVPDAQILKANRSAKALAAAASKRKIYGQPYQVRRVQMEFNGKRRFSPA
jgi:hypothetical protein